MKFKPLIWPRYALALACTIAPLAKASIDPSTFAPGVTFLTGANPFHAVAADIDGDGKVDIISANVGGGDVSILRNLGAGGAITDTSFELPFSFPAGSGVTGVAVGDVDGDGKKDIVTANFNSASISILRNTSVSGSLNASSFAAPVEFAVGAGTAFVVLADLNGDNRPEIITANQSGNSVSILRNTSTPGSVTGTSLATQIELPATGGPLGVAVGDLDGDGKPDIVSAGLSGSSITVIKNLSIGNTLSFAPGVDFTSGGGPASVAIADVDQDGKKDLVVANQFGNTVSVLRNGGAIGSITPSSFEPAVEFATGSTPRGVVVVDLDLDGRPDIATSNFSSSTVSVFQNVGPNGPISPTYFAPAVEFATGSGPYVLSSADLDGDGDLDLLTPNINANTLTVLQNVSAISAPVISQQPSSVAVIVGDSVTFSVTALGSPPLTYQWRLNGVNIPGATGASLVLPNVQLSQAGAYSVRISNSLGQLTSADAILTVTLGPTKLSIASGAVLTGQRIRLPVLVSLNGNENAIGFSLAYDPAQLRYIRSDAGKGTPSSMALNVNTNSSSVGKLGIGVALPAGTLFNQRTQALVLVTFEGVATAVSGETPVIFTDSPVDRQVSDKKAQLLSSTFLDGSVTIQSVGFEGDVTPGPTGDQRIQILDWVQVGRFAAGLDTVSSGTLFQRADCAPRNLRGNGQLSVADWVQAGRYATGLDPLTASAGPTRPGANPPPPLPAEVTSPAVRTIQIAKAAGAVGEVILVPILLAAQGDENAIGFGVSFDPDALEYLDAEVDESLAGSLLNVNTDTATSGSLGFTFGMPLSQPFVAGSQRFLTLKFRIVSAKSPSTWIRLNDSPALREVVDVAANVLEAGFLDGEIQLLTSGGSPALKIAQTATGISVSWTAPVESGVSLETSDNLRASVWTSIPNTLTRAGSSAQWAIPAGQAQQYFRLRVGE